MSLAITLENKNTLSLTSEAKNGAGYRYDTSGLLYDTLGVAYEYRYLYIGNESKNSLSLSYENKN